MDKKTREKIKRDFIERHQKTVIVVNSCEGSCAMDEYLEQEKYRRKNK
jgi:hypothetical protein